MNILAECDRRGIRLAIDGDSLKVDAPKGALSPDILAGLRAHKSDLLAALQAEDLGEHFSERAALIEFDGGLPRTEAELEAAKITATYARNAGHQWSALRMAFAPYPALRASLPDRTGPIDSLPFGVARHAVLGKRVVPQGPYSTSRPGTA